MEEVLDCLQLISEQRNVLQVASKQIRLKTPVEMRNMPRYLFSNIATMKRMHKSDQTHKTFTQATIKVKMMFTGSVISRKGFTGNSMPPKEEYKQGRRECTPIKGKGNVYVAAVGSPLLLV